MARYGITARGAINGLGDDTRAVLEGLYEGRRGLSPAPVWIGVETHVGRVGGHLPALPASLRDYDTRQARLAAACADLVADPVRRAVSRWGADRVALLMGTSTAGVADTEAAYAHYLTHGALPEHFDFHKQHAFEAILTVLREATRIGGPAYVVSTACSSSGRVFASARRLLDAGVVDAALVGGVDTLCALTVRGFRALDVVSPAPCRPFSAVRSGINIGEGAAMLLLEREADAAVELLGVGESSDAHHMTAPHPEGRGARAAMTDACRQAVDVGAASSEAAVANACHVNAHGTGTRQNDAAEGLAVGGALPGAPLVATKGATGHLLGAAGATEAVFAIAALEREQLPPSVGADPPDDLGVEINLARRKWSGRYAMSNSFAFGGANVAVLFGRAPTGGRAP